MIELLDTIFFVLRRKDRQITFLHVYHHTGMPLISWLVVKYYPGGHLTFYPMINSMVHIVMYTYYLLSAMGPKVQKYLWWKKYLTTLQLVNKYYCQLVVKVIIIFYIPYIVTIWNWISACCSIIIF